jgi:hypothetical protein
VARRKILGKRKKLFCFCFPSGRRRNEPMKKVFRRSDNVVEFSTTEKSRDGAMKDFLI